MRTVKHFIDMKGKKFGKLTVIKRANFAQWPVKWLCRCDCGNKKTIQGRHMRDGRSKSCGCYVNENSRAITHGATRGKKRWPEYNIWGHIIQRCCNPRSPRYSDYGGRGIKICKKWRNSFQAFIKDVGRRPHHLLQMDRKDNNGNYEPGNMRWATHKQQSNNRRAPKH